MSLYNIDEISKGLRSSIDSNLFRNLEKSNLFFKNHTLSSIEKSNLLLSSNILSSFEKSSSMSSHKLISSFEKATSLLNNNIFSSLEKSNSLSSHKLISSFEKAASLLNNNILSSLEKSNSLSSHKLINSLEKATSLLNNNILNSYEKSNSLSNHKLINSLEGANLLNQKLFNKIEKANLIFSNKVKFYDSLLSDANLESEFANIQESISLISEKILNSELNYEGNEEDIKCDPSQPVQLPGLQENSSKFKHNLFIFLFYFLHILDNQLQMTIFEYVTKPQISTITTECQLMKICKDEIKKNDLIGLYGQRITIENTPLYTKPNLKSENIDKLEKGKILNFINEKNLHKSWLKVEVDFNGEKVQGYLLRRHTTIIKP